MPIYEYRCGACGHELEALRKLSDAPLSTCPKCGKHELVKRLSVAGFHLKGSGWYATDFKHSGSKPAAKDAAKPDAKAEGGEAKAESGEAKAHAPSADAKPAEAKAKSDSPAATPSGATPADS